MPRQPDFWSLRRFRTGSARARSRHGRSYLLCGGSGGVLAEGDDLAGYEFLAVARLEGGAGREPAIRLAAPVEEAALVSLFKERLREVDAVEFDPERERVYARRELRLGAVVLRSTMQENPPEQALAEAVLNAAASRNRPLPPEGAKAARQLFERVAFARAAGAGGVSGLGQRLRRAGRSVSCRNPFLCGPRPLRLAGAAAESARI